MIYYVIMNSSDVTQAQLNASGARKVSNTRLSKNGSMCVLKFQESMAHHFIHEQWLTIDEVKAALESPEWDHEAPGLWDKTLSFFGF